MRNLARFLYFVIAASLSLALPAAIGADAKPTTPDELASDQARGATRLSELESRLHTLAVMLREEEPENAGRLMLALQASRRERLRDEMQEISKLLESARTTQAAEKADALITDLQELRELLTAPNIRFRLQLERLRSMLKSQESLAAIKAAQQRLREQTGEAAKQAAKEAAEAAAKARQSAPDQRDLGDRTAELSAAMSSSMAASPEAQQAVNQAQAAMSQAASSLGKGQPADATPEQDKALAQLNKANQDLQSQIDQLRQEMEAEVRAVVMATLKAMLTDQEAVVAATATKNFADSVVDRQRRVADEAEQLTKLVTETAYSTALPIVLAEISTDSRAAAADIANTIPTQKRIADTLRALVKTLEDRPPPQPQQNTNDQQQQQQQQQQQKKEDLQKIIAELKMLHFLETRLIADTVSAETAANSRAAAELRRRQVNVLDALRALQKEVNQKPQ